MLKGLIKRIGRYDGIRGPDPDEYEAWAFENPVSDSELPSNKEWEKLASVAAIFRIRNKAENSEAFPIFPNFQDLVIALESGSYGADLLFIKRAVNKDDHYSGDVAFPGGKWHSGEDGLECVVREVKEEVGIELSHSTHLLLGRLKEVQAKNCKVTCYVFLINDPNCVDPVLTCDPSEVSHAWWVDTDQFFPDSNHEEIDYPISKFELSKKYLFVRLAEQFLGIDKVYFPCFYLPVPPKEKTENKPNRDFCLWGLTFWMVNDISYCAGGKKCLWLPPYFLFHSVIGDFIMVFGLWLYAYLLEKWGNFVALKKEQNGLLEEREKIKKND